MIQVRKIPTPTEAEITNNLRIISYDVLKHPSLHFVATNKETNSMVTFESTVADLPGLRALLQKQVEQELHEVLERALKCGLDASKLLQLKGDIPALFNKNKDLITLSDDFNKLSDSLYQENLKLAELVV